MARRTRTATAHFADLNMAQRARETVLCQGVDPTNIWIEAEPTRLLSLLLSVRLIIKLPDQEHFVLQHLLESDASRVDVHDD